MEELKRAKIELAFGSLGWVEDGRGKRYHRLNCCCKLLSGREEVLPLD